MTEFSKEERLAEVWKRLGAAPEPCSHDEAHQLLGDFIHEVEDDLTDIPRDPVNWQTDGRMYPPQEDSARVVFGRSDVVRYRSRGHHTFIRTNGAIEVRDTAGTVVFAKSGSDGAGVELEE